MRMQRVAVDLSQGADPKLTQMLRLMVHGEALLGTEGPGKAAFPRLALSQALASSGSGSSIATGNVAGGASEWLLQVETLRVNRKDSRR